jgi:DNA-binding CsgD family transcriptional regulator
MAASSRARQKAPSQSRAHARTTPDATDGILLTSGQLGGEEFIVLSEPINLDSRDLALTDAERALANLVAQGCSNRTIASKRGVSAQTVANQLAGMYRKLGVSSRSAMVANLRQLRNG